MTRRERMGTIVILLIVAMLLAGTLMVRSCRHDDVVLASELRIDEFEAAADSASAALSVPQVKKHGKRDGAKKSRKSRPGGKPSRPERKTAPKPIEPVPQF